MDTEAALIDEVVRRVMSALRTSSAAAALPAPASQGAEIPYVDAPVVTHTLLAEQAGQARRVRVRPRAILTPSARDYVRSRQIDVVRDPGGGRPAAVAARSAWQVLIVSAAPQALAALDALAHGGLGLERRIPGTTHEAVEQAVAAVCRGEVTGALLLTAEPELAACLANRNEQVRAAAVRCATGFAALRKSLDPNLYAVDPTDKGAFELQQLLKLLVT